MTWWTWAVVVLLLSAWLFAVLSLFVRRRSAEWVVQRIFGPAARAQVAENDSGAARWRNVQVKPATSVQYFNVSFEYQLGDSVWVLDDVLLVEDEKDVEREIRARVLRHLRAQKASDVGNRNVRSL